MYSAKIEEVIEKYAADQIYSLDHADWYSLHDYIKQIHEKFRSQLAVPGGAPHDRSQNPNRNPIDDELSLILKHDKILFEDMADQLLNHIERLQWWAKNKHLLPYKTRRAYYPLDVRGMVFDGVQPVVQAAYESVCGFKYQALALAEESLAKRRAYVFEHYSSRRLGWLGQVFVPSGFGQTFEYCMVARSKYERIEPRWTAEGELIPVLVDGVEYKELKVSGVEVFQIIPDCLGGEELSYLFGVRRLLLADPQNALTMHQHLGALLSTGGAVIVPFTPVEGTRIRWKFVLTWKPTADKSWNGVLQDVTYEQFDGQELNFLGPNRPAVRYLYFRFILTYMYWVKRGEGQDGKDGLDWARGLEKDGALWAVPGPWLRARFLRVVCRLILGGELPPQGYKDCTFDVVEGLNREPKDEHVIADSLRKKIESNIYHQKPEEVNMARMQG